MAKQRGIHQISGKINNLCYYEQKYIRGGLIRRINEAMSERLKTDPVFENTRHANTIFGGCSQYAKTLLSFFGNRNTYLFTPYRQAKLTEIVRKNFLTNDEAEGYPIINISGSFTSVFSVLLNSIFKNPLRNNFPSISSYVGDVVLDSTYEFVFEKEELSNFCKKYKCNKVQVTISRPHYIYGSSYESLTGAYFLPDANPGGRSSFTYWENTSDSENLVISAPTGSTDDAATFWIVYVSPVLREYQRRPIIGETGSSVGIVQFVAH